MREESCQGMPGAVNNGGPSRPQPPDNWERVLEELAAIREAIDARGPGGPCRPSEASPAAPPEKRTLESLLDEWIAIKALRMKPKSHGNLRYLLRRHWVGFMGGLAPDEIGPREIQGLYVSRDRDGRANATLNYERR